MVDVVKSAGIRFLEFFVSATRHLFKRRVVGQVVSHNPAASMRGPTHTACQGKTPMLERTEARQLLDSIDITTPIGLRDPALIVFSFARKADHQVLLQVVRLSLLGLLADRLVDQDRWWHRCRGYGCGFAARSRSVNLAKQSGCSPNDVMKHGSLIPGREQDRF